MPKYTFECETCATHFTRNLKMGEHPHHPCPSCKAPAPRFWPGQSFSHEFAMTAGTMQANSGVSKDDYPTADHMIGKSSDQRWAELSERDKVKKKVREVGGSRALIRRNGPGYIEYEAGGDQVIAKRKALMKEANAAYQAQQTPDQ